ncbi:MAG: HAMP domain-containing sensor histidine kinase [Clostridia bacterium]
MELKSRKRIRLYMLFLRYLTVFCCLTILLIAMIGLSFYIAMESGAILPANDAERNLKQAEKQLIESKPFDASIIPFPSVYALFDHNDQLISDNMTDEELRQATDFLKEKQKTSPGRYLRIDRAEETCIIQYDILAHFSSPILHKWFPKPETISIALFFLAFFSLAGVIAVLFGKKLGRELSPLILATDAIKRQELDFIILPTHIQEFHTILESIEDMKTALEGSLNQQWNAEQSRKARISVITHDIKTPLTIIKGNTELMLEADSPQIDKGLLEAIHISSDKIEQYLAQLMAAAKAESAVDFDPKPFSVGDMLSEIEWQAKALCLSKNMTLTMEKKLLPENFCGDQMLMIRAVLNILTNAIEWSPPLGHIDLTVGATADMLTFTVTDSGSGFSAKSLQNATQKFYTEHRVRDGRHYGLGLFIAQSAADNHHGRLYLANKTNGSGAVVTLTIRRYT